MERLKTLVRGSSGPQTELLQLALKRAKFAEAITGEFDDSTFETLKMFQLSNGIANHGAADEQTWQALLPFLTGCVTHTLRPGDSLDSLASDYGARIPAIITANPDVCWMTPAVGLSVTIPLNFEVVSSEISFTSTALSLCIRGLAARYPFLRVKTIGKSVMGRPLYLLEMGTGTRDVFYNAAHHANEWITSPLLLRFVEKYAAAYATHADIFSINADSLYSKTMLSLVPMVNPDGVDLVTGDLCSGEFFENAMSLSAEFPDIPFPSGWKANIRGIDLNLQYPAAWENAHAVKYAQGVTRPGPRDFVGAAPLTEPESRALYDLTNARKFALTLSFHTQGKTIYWKYLDYEPNNSYKIAEIFAHASGYDVEETPVTSGYAGYKDWFISTFNRPGYTIEAGEGTSPLPIKQLLDVETDCLGIFSSALLKTVEIC